MAGAKEARTSHLNSSHLFTYNKLFEPEYRENNILWDFVREGRKGRKEDWNTVQILFTPLLP